MLYFLFHGKITKTKKQQLKKMKIVTFTPNPAIDLYALTTEKISPNEIAKTTKEEYFPGGKGINISRVLLSFGFQTTSLFCTAGFNGQKLANLCRESCNSTALVCGTSSSSTLDRSANCS